MENNKKSQPWSPLAPPKAGKHPETVGSKLAAKARGLANSLSDSERESHLHKAMAIIYGL